MHLTPHNSNVDNILVISEEKREDYDELLKEIVAIENKLSVLKADVKKKLELELELELQRCNKPK